METLRCKVKTTRTTTRRIATFDPNFLAFPKHDKPGGVDYGKQVRSCFVCPPGELFLESDYSQIEVRMLAHESRDSLLCRMFTDKRDVHTETAARIFGVPASEIGKEDVRRFFAKRVTFRYRLRCQRQWIGDSVAHGGSRRVVSRGVQPSNQGVVEAV